MVSSLVALPAYVKVSYGFPLSRLCDSPTFLVNVMHYSSEQPRNGTSVLGYSQCEFRTSTCSFARTTHGFTCSALLVLLACSTVLIFLLFCSLTCFRAHGKEVFIYDMNVPIQYSYQSLCAYLSLLMERCHFILQCRFVG